MIPFAAEAILIEGLPRSFRDLEARSVIEFCRIDVVASGPFEIEISIPCLWHLCKDRGCVLLAEEAESSANGQIAILMRKLYA